MRWLLASVLLFQIACWSEQRFTQDCLDAGHCTLTSDGGTDGGAGDLTWNAVAAELFDIDPATDAGFDLEFHPTSVTGKWVGAVLTRSNTVICIPYEGPVIEVFPNGQVTPKPQGLQGAWQGGVLLNDGGVLGLASSRGFFLAASASLPFPIDAGFPRPGAENEPYFEGGVITLSNQVLLAPNANLAPASFNPDTRVLTLHDAGLPLTNGNAYRFFAGAVLRPDGESAYVIPRHALELMVVSPTGAERFTGDNFEGHMGGLLLQDESLLLIPGENAEFIHWDGTTTARHNMGLNRSGYYSAAWSNNGFAYSLQVAGPSTGLHVAIIDRTGIVSEVPLAADAGLFQNSHYGLVGTEDGTLVGCPYLSSDVVFLKPHVKRSVSLRARTSPWLNKW